MTPELEKYADEHTTPEYPVLAKLYRETHLSQVYPRMLSGHLQGTLLRMFSAMVQPMRILEIGTFTGYSAICLAGGMPENAILHTIEADPELEEIITRYVDEAGLKEKVILHIGQGMDVIPKLNETWDLVFIDADKPNYLNYYNLVFDNVRKGGIILADNVLWDGKVLKPETRSRDTRGIIEFNEFVQQDERVENLILPVRDGLMVIRKIA
ncbi:MAG: O-methyltransferase [Bacteroidetes bacterium]|nr:O-methyltransferase [Bacteroidota bacterium]